MSETRAVAARIGLGWIDSWQVEPDQLELTFDYLTNLEERAQGEDVDQTDFDNLCEPVVAVCAAIIALCDAFGVERFSGIDEIRAEVP